MPRPWLAGVSPAALRVEAAFALVPAAGPRPLSIATGDSVWAWLLFSAACLLFLTARRAFEAGGTRTVARAVAVAGLALAGVALAQSATAKGLMYWHFAPPREGPAPFGPFTNRNHFGTWAMMAVPLGLGYLAAHAAVHPHTAGDSWRHRLLAALDARAWLLVASCLALLVAAVASLSRSGMVGMGVALASGAVLWRRREGGRRESRRRGHYAALLAAAGTLGILTQVGFAALSVRFGASGAALADRAAIWHDTLPVLRDFWLTGTGAGTFQTAMAVYQRSRPEVIFNQAHNHYLQVASEGGLLLGLPVGLAMLAFVRAAALSLRTDRTSMYYLRAGAAAGLAGVAVQSVWETGLTVPANAVLAAVLAAILVHTPPQRMAER